MKKIIDAEALEDYKLRVRFSDNAEGIVDLSDMVGEGVFALWEDYNAFRRFEIGESGELVWSDQIDLCPDALYIEVTGKKPVELFPGLGADAACA